MTMTTTTTVAPDAIGTSTLLTEAVHRSSGWSAEGLSERLFTAAFGGLVYAQIWEDPVVDLEAMALRPDSRVVTIASGGCNALSYLTAGPAEVVAIDLNAAHVALNRLKQAAVRSLDHAGFQSFIEGRADDPAGVFDRRIAADLDEATRDYWTGRDRLGRRRITAFGRNIYRTGLLGRFIGAAHLLARALGVDPRGILAARDVAEQRAFFEARLSPLFERRIVRLMLRSPASLFGLGIPPAQYRALGTAGPTMADVVRERLRRLACDFPLRENYFAWQAFNRAYGPAGSAPRPLYLQASCFGAVKANIDRLSVVHGSLTSYLEAAAPGRFDRLVLLDAQDWMSPAELTRLWRAIDRAAGPEARVIFRTAGTASILPGRLPPDLLARWSYREAESAALHARDRSAIYGGFHLYVRAH